MHDVCQQFVILGLKSRRCARISASDSTLSEHRPSNVPRIRTNATLFATLDRLPFSEILRVLVKMLVHQFRGNSKPAEHFDAKMAKVGMPSKNGAHHHEQRGIHRRHDDERTDPIAPWPCTKEREGRRQKMVSIFARKRRRKAPIEQSLGAGLTVFQAPLQPQHVRHRRSHEKHGAGPRDPEDRTNQRHFSVPSRRVPRRHGLGAQKSVQEGGATLRIARRPVGSFAGAPSAGGMIRPHAMSWIGTRTSTTDGRRRDGGRSRAAGGCPTEVRRAQE